jgi:uncharacterized protein
MAGPASRTEFAQRYGPVAVVTGAAQGIGAGFARALSTRGINLVLTDINAEKLEQTAEGIQESGCEVTTLALDLGDRSAPAKLFAATEGVDVGLFICNHLQGTPTARFLDGDIEDFRSEIEVNVRAYVDLAHHFGRRLRALGRGGMILMSSMTGVVGSPGVTTYGSAKAYVLAFGSALAYELRNDGVDVLTLVPSAVNTETYQRVEQQQASGFAPMEVDEFVTRALRELGRKPVAVPGRRNALTAQIMQRVLPRRVSVTLMGRSLEKIVGL